MGRDDTAGPDLTGAGGVAAEVLRTISGALGQSAGGIDPSQRMDDLGVDSHALAEMVLELEDRFDFEFSPEEVDALAGSETIGQVIQIVSAARAARC